MTISPAVRKVALTADDTTSVGCSGALAAVLVHAVARLGTEDIQTQTVRAISLAMGLSAWFVILPLSIAVLVTRFVQGIGTA